MSRNLTGVVVILSVPYFLIKFSFTIDITTLKELYQYYMDLVSYDVSFEIAIADLFLTII